MRSTGEITVTVSADGFSGGMSLAKLVHLSDKVIMALDKIRTKKQWSYSQVIAWLIQSVKGM